MVKDARITIFWDLCFDLTPLHTLVYACRGKVKNLLHLTVWSSLDNYTVGWVDFALFYEFYVKAVSSEYPGFEVDSLLYVITVLYTGPCSYTTVQYCTVYSTVYSSLRIRTRIFKIFPIIPCPG